MSTDVDLIIVGAGMAGMNAAARAVDAGARVAIIERGARGAQDWLDSLAGRELIQGEARLEGPRAVRVDGRVVTAPNIIIASGAEPGVVPIPGLDRTPL